MEKSLTEILYGKDMKEAIELFDTRMKEIENKYSDFLEENEIDFRKSYLLSWGSNKISYVIKDGRLSENIKLDVEKAFRDTFANNKAN